MTLAQHASRTGEGHMLDHVFGKDQVEAVAREREWPDRIQEDCSGGEPGIEFRIEPPVEEMVATTNVQFRHLFTGKVTMNLATRAIGRPTKPISCSSGLAANKAICVYPLEEIETGHRTVILRRR
jgi:hypothetical protein